jgi:hypothetical protein
VLARRNRLIGHDVEADRALAVPLGLTIFELDTLDHALVSLAKLDGYIVDPLLTQKRDGASDLGVVIRHVRKGFAKEFEVGDGPVRGM